MIIDIIKKKVYAFIKQRNDLAANGEVASVTPYRVETLQLIHMGRAYGYKRSEVGYALQLLKSERKIAYNTKYGWLAR